MRSSNAGEPIPLRRGLRPMHPGELLREDVIPHLEATRAEIVEALGISRITLNRLERGAGRVDADLAVKLGKLVGNGPELWLNLQSAYDLSQAKVRLAAQVARIPTLKRRDAA